eukprot:g26135.t1
MKDSSHGQDVAVDAPSSVNDPDTFTGVTGEHVKHAHPHVSEVSANSIASAFSETVAASREAVRVSTTGRNLCVSSFEAPNMG